MLIGLGGDIIMEKGTINDLVMLKALFNEELDQMVKEKDLTGIKKCLKENYAFDIWLHNNICRKSGRLNDMYKFSDLNAEIAYDKLEMALKEDLRWTYY